MGTKVIDLKGIRCPCCLELMDSSTGVDMYHAGLGDAQPKVGDATICPWCYYPLRFKEGCFGGVDLEAMPQENQQRLSEEGRATYRRVVEFVKGMHLVAPSKRPPPVKRKWQKPGDDV